MAEFLGTCFLVATVVGSGIMAERLAGGNLAIALLANTIATGAALAALIQTFGPLSGAHLNPAVTLADAMEHGIPWREVPAYIAAQFSGGIVGTAIAHLMFGLRIFSESQHGHHGVAQILSEFVATFGLMCVIWGCSRLRAGSVPYAVGAYITAAYWFTASTSFANPAVTVARALSDTFSGIRPTDAPAFIAAQLSGAVSATLIFRMAYSIAPTKGGEHSLAPQLGQTKFNENLPIRLCPQRRAFPNCRCTVQPLRGYEHVQGHICRNKACESGAS